MPLSQLHMRARQMKEALVAKEGIQDLAPFMVVTTDDNETYFGHCNIGMEAALQGGVRMGDILAASVTTLRLQHGNVPVLRMMLVVEGYCRQVAVTAPDEAHARVQATQHGDLEKDYQTNPDSDVSEMLMTNIWHYHSDHDIVFEMHGTAFHYTDGGVLVWDEDLAPPDSGTVDGAIAAAGKAVMR